MWDYKFLNLCFLYLIFSRYIGKVLSHVFNIVDKCEDEPEEFINGSKEVCEPGVRPL